MEGLVHSLIHLKDVYVNILSAIVDFVHMMQPTIKKSLLVMAGGGIGAITRYGVSLLAAKVWGTQFPWGTLIVNLAGCFLIGFLVALADRGRFLTPETRLLMITGFLGALTTFSTFSLETVSAGRAGMALLPLTNILVNNLGGFFLTLLGLWIGNLK